MSYKEKLKAAQTTGTDYPKIEPSFFLKMKEIEGKAVFAYWSKEKEKDIINSQPITGMLVGTAMNMEAYSDDLGRNGGSYKSTYYFNKSHQLGILAPKKDGFGIVFKGTAVEAETWLNKEAGTMPHKKAILFILTVKGELIAVQTNLSIAIDQLNAFKGKETLFDNMITLTPRIFASDNKDISTKCKTILGKFASKNPPKYAEISVAGAITDEWIEEVNGETVIDKFAEWKKYVLDSNVTVDEKKEEEKPMIDRTTEKYVAPENPKLPEPEDEPFDDSSDLPF